MTGRSPSPGGKLLDSTYSSRAKTGNAAPGDTNRQPRSYDERKKSDDSDYYSRPNSSIEGSTSYVVADSDNPFSGYKSFEQFRNNRDGSRQEEKTSSKRLSRNFESDQYSSSSLQNSNFTVKHNSNSYGRSDYSSGTGRGSYNSGYTAVTSGYNSASQGYNSGSTGFRKVSNTSSEGDSFSNDYEPKLSYATSAAYKSRSSFSSSSLGKSSFSSSYSSSSSPSKVSLGALKRATISAWDE